MHKSILFIAYDYPPILSPESIQIQRRALTLADNGIRVFILTSHDNPLFDTADPALVIEHEKIEVIKTKRPCCEKLLNIIFKLAEITDRKFWWQYLAYPRAKALIEEEGIGTIYSHATPLVDHLIGLKLKKHYPALHWIAHFSDPWTLNPYVTYRTLLQKKINQRLEEEVLKQADVLTVTSEKTKVLFESCFNIGTKISVLPHVFDSRYYHMSEVRPHAKKIVVHTGNIYGLRTVRYLLESLKERKPDNVEFHFYGRIKPEEARLVAAYGLEYCVKLFPQVPYLESLEAISRSDVLLVVDAPLENSPFFPSKLADYIGASKPVMALTPPDSTTAEILHHIKNDALIAASDDLEGINRVLSTIESMEFGRQRYENVDQFNMQHSFETINKVFFGDR